ncbi:hypothetical protein B9Z55_006889 [Caenorhabditis nigoni]|uniref:Uncharacterized protein n=1 Tax=Caenorhabditis nigoni TaxID=1611254 RepID=A0A2G5V708_9PELO|nr:hypothetical protein B9Z55_006889 [Caenorhabditis nigoni]
MWKVENLSSEVQFWWTDDVAEMPEIQSIRKDWCLFLGGFLVWYYMFILITCFFILALERTCASYFIQNYEKTSRSYIFILLFLFQHGMVLVMLWFCFFNRIAFSLCFLFTFSLNAFAVLLLWANRQYNVILIRKFERNTKKSVEMYTLPARFQAKENVKAFDVRNPLIVCPAMILSVYPWRKRLSRWKITRSVSCSTSQKELLGQGMGQQQETDFYFNQLNVSWERHVK